MKLLLNKEKKGREGRESFHGGLEIYKRGFGWKALTIAKKKKLKKKCGEGYTSLLIEQKSALGIKIHLLVT